MSSTISKSKLLPFDELLEPLLKSLPLEKTSDFIQFRNTFLTNFDFERIKELASS